MAEINLDLPEDLLKKLEKSAKDADFDSVEAYLKYVLEELVSDEAEVSEEDEKKIKERLADLGYMD